MNNPPPESIPSKPAQITPRDSRIDLIRGIALLVIFSDHIPGNGLRDFMPVSLGFSDMAEVFVFLSGYLNGLRRNKADSLRSRLAAMPARCVRIYVSILLIHAVVALLFAAARRMDLTSVSITGLMLPGSDRVPEISDVLTLRRLLLSSSVLAFYLIVIVATPFVAAILHFRTSAGVAVSVALYLAVQFWPQTIALPDPWGKAMFFNPMAWQLPFVLGMACGIEGRRYKALIPRGALAEVAAIVGLIVAWLWRADWPSDVGFGTDKATLGPLRLAHFYCVLILGRALLTRESRVAASRVIQPLVWCGRNPLTTYAVGACLAAIATILIAETRPGALLLAGINVAGWLTSIVAARVGDLYTGAIPPLDRNST